MRVPIRQALAPQTMAAANDSQMKQEGLPESIIRKFKKTICKKDKNSLDVCSICLIEAKKGDKLHRLDCNHLFHRKCILAWFETSTNCPNCRKDLMPAKKKPPVGNPN